MKIGHAASYPALGEPAASGATQLSIPLAPHTLASIEREARAMRLTPDQLVNRALLALADEIDAERCARRAAGAVPPAGAGPR
ncbi:hypothetical protein [Burkholderia gladioli]|uniref:hypothetical protein n=1 Tax=Burkholderia gladioli TaxID=28095 RepID=UPI00163E054B|nr:hypothetical protein [Burkholderia gladioli]